MSAKVIYKDLGLIDYKEAWDYQSQLFDKTVATKISNRKNEAESQLEATENYLIFCEHPHVFTLGKSGSESNLLLAENMLKMHNATYYKINRGGDITYHGPGQLVGYPIFDLEAYFFTDIHKYMRFLEEAIILTLTEYGIKSGRVDGMTGVWLDGDNKYARKICAMGVKCSRWVTMHGFALNANVNLEYFNHIVPCGISDKAVTSIEKELSKPVDMEALKERLKLNLSNVFDFDLIG